MKFDALAQRIIQENQSQGSSTEERAATAQAHAPAEAKRGAKNIYIEFISKHGADVAKQIDDDISKRSHTDINDPIGLHRYHSQERFKVTNYPKWLTFIGDHNLRLGVDFKVAYSPAGN